MIALQFRAPSGHILPRGLISEIGHSNLISLKIADFRALAAWGIEFQNGLIGGFGRFGVIGTKM